MISSMLWGKPPATPSSTKLVTTVEKHRRLLEQIATLKMTSNAAFDALKDSRKEVSRLRARVFTLEATISRLEFPPRWVPDESRATCACCDSPFSFTNRRHHCRACGDLFDDDCTKNKSCLPRWGFNEPVRVCDSCYDQTLLIPTSNFGTLSEASLACDELAAQVLGLGGLGHEAPSPEKPVAPPRVVEAAQETAAASNSRERAAPKGPARSEIPFPPPIPDHLLRAPVARPALVLPASRKPLKSLQNDAGPPRVGLSLSDIANGRNRLKPVTREHASISRAVARTPSPIAFREKHDMMSELKRSLQKRREQLSGSPSLLLDETETLIVDENVSPNRRRSKRRAARKSMKDLEKLMPAQGSNGVANTLFGPPIITRPAPGGSSDMSWLG